MKGQFGGTGVDDATAAALAIDWRGVSAAIACISIVGFGLSLSTPLLSLMLEARGVSSTLIGINTAMGGVASLLTAPLVPSLVRRIGTTALLYAALVVGALSFLLFPVSPFWLWFPLRVVFTAAVTVLFVVSEFWIAAAAPDARRGFVMGVYATVLSIGFALGPAALAVLGSESLVLLLLVPLAFAAGMLPVALGAAIAPTVEHAPSLRFLALLLVAPSATLAAFVFGAFEQSMFAFAPLYALRAGLDETTAALLISMAGVGNMLLQIPIGLAADRTNRTLALAVCGIVGLVGALLLPLAMSSPAALLPLTFLWGGMAGGLYTVGLTHLGARFSGADLAAANSLFVMLYSLGMLVGPAAAGAGMDVWSPHGFAWVVAGMFGLYTLMALGRWIAGARRD